MGAGVGVVEGRGRAARARQRAIEADVSRFFEAVEQGYERTVCRMLKQGFDPDQLNTAQGGWSRGQHALGAAIDGEEPSILRLLLKWGADPDRVNAVHATPAMIAVEMSDVDSLHALYAFGADMNAAAGPLARTALFSTLRLNLTADRPDAVIDALVACGADVDQRDAGGMTALMAGITEHTTPTPLAGLLRHGARTDVECTLHSPATARGAAAAAHTHRDAEAGAGQRAAAAHGDVFATSQTWTALTLAARWEREDLLEMLLEAGRGRGRGPTWG